MKVIPISSLFFCLGLFLASQLSNAQKSIDSSKYYQEIIINPRNSNDLSSAYSYYENLIEKDIKIRDTIGAIRNLRYLIGVQFDLGFLFESEEYAIRAMSLVDELKVNDETNEIKKALHNELGKIYRRLYNYNRALDYYNQSLKYSIDLSDSLLIFNNRANVYRDQREYERALNELEWVYKKRLQLNDSIELARALDNLAFVQSKIDHPDAILNMLKALQLRLDLDDKKGLFSSYRHLTYYYNDKALKKEASYYANESYSIAKSLNSVSYLQEARSLLILSGNNSRIIEYKKSLDSISKAKQLRENKFFGMKYDHFKEKKRADEAEIDKQKQKIWKLIFLGLGLFVFVISSFIYFLIKSKHKKEKLQEVFHTESQISKKVHDEVANDVYHIMNKLQEEPLLKEGVLDELEQVYSKTRNIAKEHSALEVQENFKGTLQDLLLSYANDTTNVITKDLDAIDWASITALKKTTLYKVLQELMINMKKHSRATITVVSFIQSRNTISINYSDNGVGAVLKKGNGLQNVETRIRLVGGVITFDYQIDKGFKVKISV